MSNYNDEHILRTVHVLRMKSGQWGPDNVKVALDISNYNNERLLKTVHVLLMTMRRTYERTYVCMKARGENAKMYCSCFHQGVVFFSLVSNKIEGSAYLYILHK